MNTLKILMRKASTKLQLRQALAHELKVDCPAFEKQKVTVFTRCKEVFLQRYRGAAQIEYSWQTKDNVCLTQIIQKLYAIVHDTTDDSILAAFTYLMANLPQWYQETGFSLCVINGKFNEIVKEIKSKGNGSTATNVSSDYKQRILRDLQS